MKPYRSVPKTRPFLTRPHLPHDWKKRVLRFVGLCLTWGAVALIVLFAWYGRDLPDTSKAFADNRRPSVTILAEDGSIIGRYGDQVGAYLGLNDLPESAWKAVVSVEDRRFFMHFGIDPKGIARAMLRNITTGQLMQGGSTITQQLAKNLFLSPERNLKRKIQEVILALWLEHRYTKQQILTTYLNRVYYGSGAYGIDAAAQIYFGKSARNLDLRESALLAGLLKAPSRYAPTVSPVRAAERARVVLGTMVETRAITREQAQAAMAAPPAPRRKPGSGDSVRYFTDMIMEQSQQYNFGDNRDLVIRTTLDSGLQRSAENRLSEVLASSGANSRAEQGAVVVMSPEGAIRALVGGKSWGESQFNRATQAQRQPGSSFKMFVYATALENGWKVTDTLEDSPLRIGKWSPRNYEGNYSGTVTLQNAFAESLNIPAIRLAQSVGVGRVIAMAQRMGIASPLENNLSIALGTSEVNLLELTSAYAILANRGWRATPYAILEIQDSQNNILYRHKTASGPVLSPRIVAGMQQLMQGVTEYGTGTGAYLGRPSFAKTGTSQDHKDAWFIGFTENLVAGVWLGNDDNSMMRRVTGGGLPAQIWKSVMLDGGQGAAPEAALEPALTPLPQPVPTESTEQANDGGLFGTLIDTITGN